MNILKRINQQTLDDSLDHLKTLRELAYEIEYSIDKKIEQLEKNDLYVSMTNDKQRLKEIKDQIAGLESNVRESALHLSSKDNYETRDFNGVKVKRFNIVEILDESEAKKWAIQYVPDAVTLSKTKFNTSVRNLELPFIKKIIEYRAQIPSKL